MSRALIGAIALFLAASAAEARDWTADHRASRLAISAWREAPSGDAREAFEAVVTVWRAEIKFDPAAPEAARLDVEIDIGSLNTGDGGLNAEIAASGWLDAAKHPTARYTAEGFAPLGDGRYRIDGALTLRGVTAPTQLTMTLDLADGAARARGGGKVKRLDFGVGAYAGARSAAALVDVTFDIRAEPKN